jgi:hypothetical protein
MSGHMCSGNGQRRIDILEFIRIARALGMDATKLFDKIEKKARGGNYSV